MTPELPVAVQGSFSSLREPRVAHRVAVFDVVPDQATPDGPTLNWEVQHVISQSDVVRLIASQSRVKNLGPAFEQPVEELGLCTVCPLLSRCSLSRPF